MSRNVPQTVLCFCLVPAGLVALLAVMHAATGAVTASPDAQRARVEADVMSAMTRAGKATYWVVLREQTDLSGSAKRDHKSRGRFVVDKLKKTAKHSQSGLKDLLHARGADVTEFWAANVVKVTSDEDTLEAVAALPEVAEVQADRVFSIPEPMAGTRALLDQTAVDANDRSCGGTAADNNVYGQGRLDAYGAAAQAPRAAVGELQGTVTDAATENPLPGTSATRRPSRWRTPR